MGIKFFYFWLILCWIAILLATFRNDWQRIKKDMIIAFYGGLIKKLLVVIILLPILPFTIYYSIRNILNK